MNFEQIPHKEFLIFGGIVFAYPGNGYLTRMYFKNTGWHGLLILKGNFNLWYTHPIISENLKKYSFICSFIYSSIPLFYKQAMNYTLRKLGSIFLPIGILYYVKGISRYKIIFFTVICVCVCVCIHNININHNIKYL